MNLGANRNGSSKRPKGNDDIKRIELGQCFGPAFCLTNTKWRPSYVMASRDKTLVLRANVNEVDAIMDVRHIIYSFFNLTIANKLVSQSQTAPPLPYSVSSRFRYADNWTQRSDREKLQRASISTGIQTDERRGIISLVQCFHHQGGALSSDV